MSKINAGLLLFAIVLMPWIAFAQNTTNSPYTRYGYGKLANQASGNQKGMGGIGYGLRDSRNINPINPASFSRVDSMTFMVDVGVSTEIAWYNEGGDKVKKNNGKLDYVAMQFPLYKGLGMGFGFEPVSAVGYQYGQSSSLSPSVTETRSYTGSGGINQLYGAISYNFAKQLSLGVNVAYAFGNIYHNQQITNTQTASNTGMSRDTLRTGGVTLDVGLQYTLPYKDGQFVLGLVYAPKMDIGSKIAHGDFNYNSSTGVLVNDDHVVYEDVHVEMPETYGIGLTYNKFHRWTAGADFEYQKWADTQSPQVSSFQSTDTLQNRMRINAGGEFIPNARGRNYFGRMSYRIGGYYSDSYIQVQGAGYKEYGASLGFGFPLLDNRSVINVAFEYTKIKPDVVKLVDEQYFKCTVSYTFNELWFFKRKVQ